MRWLLALVSLLLLVSAGSGVARAGGTQDEAARQVELARKDIDQGQYERAISACDSALRLDATAQEAFKLKGLALEQMGQIDDARGMLLAYNSLRSGLPEDPEVEAALARMARPPAAATVVVVERAPPERQPRPRRERKPPPKDAVMAVVVMLAGGGVSAAGFGVHALAYEEAAPNLHGDVYVGDSARYAQLYELNQRGFQIGVGGAVVAGVGLTLTIMSAARHSRDVSRPAAPLPWASAGPEGGMVGLMGSLP
jgi:tetratricopeptide (TPR) repeat protein